MKSKITAAYVLGITMGIIIMLFLSAVNGSQGQQSVSIISEESSQNNSSMEIKVLEQQNSRLEKQLEDLKTNKEIDQAPVKLVIENEMSNSAIAKMLVSNGVYPHENDLLLILEMLSFDKEKASEQLESIGAVESAETHLRALTVYENRRDEIIQSFVSNDLVQDQKSFEKLIYIFRGSTNIRPGEKIFGKNISLREIVDILVN